jgi:hypothetical protein
MIARDDLVGEGERGSHARGQGQRQPTSARHTHDPQTIGTVARIRSHSSNYTLSNKPTVCALFGATKRGLAGWFDEHKIELPGGSLGPAGAFWPDYLHRPTTICSISHHVGGTSKAGRGLTIPNGEE